MRRQNLFLKRGAKGVPCLAAGAVVAGARRGENGPRGGAGERWWRGFRTIR
jgi:hypothetical protein